MTDARVRSAPESLGELQGVSLEGHARRFEISTLKAGNDCDACSLRNGAGHKSPESGLIEEQAGCCVNGVCRMQHANAQLLGELLGQFHG